MKRGTLTVVSGFSGAGKGTLMRKLLDTYDNYALSVSATTRSPREGEVDGREYFFKTDQEFQQMIKDDELIEYAGYVNHFYGTPKAFVEKQLDAGKDVLLEIEIQGALKVKAKRPDTHLLFVTPPNAEELKRRLTARGTEDEETIQKRLSTASIESEYMKQYDYIVVNDDIDRCAKEMHEIIQSFHSLSSENKELIDRLNKELKGFRKEK